MIALVEVTVTDMVGLNERGAFAGIVALSWALLGTVIGPIMGGAIAEKTTWRWYTASLFILISGSSISTFPSSSSLSSESGSSSLSDPIHRLSKRNSSELMSSVSLSLSSAVQPPSSSVSPPEVCSTIGTQETSLPRLSSALPGLVLFWFIEERFAKEPMMPMRVFKERTALAGYIGTWAHGIILWGIIYYGVLFVRPFDITLISVSSRHGSHHPSSRGRCSPHHLDHRALRSHRRHCHDCNSPISACSLGRLDHHPHRLRSLYPLQPRDFCRTTYRLLYCHGSGYRYPLPSLQFASQAGQPDEDVAIATSTFVLFALSDKPLALRSAVSSFKINGIKIWPNSSLQTVFLSHSKSAVIKRKVQSHFSKICHLIFSSWQEICTRIRFGQCGFSLFRLLQSL